MSDLKVNRQLLVESESSLKVIQREFSRCPQRMDDLAEDSGAQPLRDAMHEFSDNWSDNRKLMVENIEDLLKLVKSTRVEFDKLEAELSKESKKSKKETKKI